MKIKFVITLVFSALLAIGCTKTGGKKIDITELATLKKDVTTYDDVIRRFGEPSSTQLTNDGIAVQYTSWTQTIDGKAFIPVVGGFLDNNTNGTAKSVTLIFDSQTKKLKSILSTDTNAMDQARQFNNSSH